MAETHRTTLEPGTLELLGRWLPAQRWYAGKGGVPQLRTVGGFRLDDPAGEVGIEVLLVADHSGARPVVYQVPLTYRARPLDGADAALVGLAERGVLGRRWVYDAPHDPVFAGELLALIEGRALALTQSESDPPEPTVLGHHVAGPTVVLETSSVLRGEQSNTSVVCTVREVDGSPADPVIVKVFRTVQPGDNPDVVVQSALTEAGSSQVPETVGYVSACWRPPERADLERGHLAFAQRFFPGAEDAWRLAERAAAGGTDFTTSAREIGAATGRIHLSLAAALGTTPATEGAKHELVDSMRARYAEARRELPSLSQHEDAVRAILDDLGHRQWPDLQRVHGDYHLGQVLQVAGRGWVAVDFEGEPARPLAERVRPDLGLRDVAGMLRSFDYAGGSVEQGDPGCSRRDWVESCRAAFLEGYATVTHLDVDAAQPMVGALELDKALYEVVYEARNRPTWRGVPAAAIDRLLPDSKVAS